MLPTPSDPMVAGRAPRHAAGAAPDGSRGRHRRPESLADSPPPAAPGRASYLTAAAVDDPWTTGEWTRYDTPGDSLTTGTHGADIVTGSSYRSDSPDLPSYRADPAYRADPGSGADRPAVGAPNAWAFESTSEWLLTGRRSRARREAAETHPADAAITAARHAAARLRQDRGPDGMAAEAPGGGSHAAAGRAEPRRRAKAGRRSRAGRRQAGAQPQPQNRHAAAESQPQNRHAATGPQPQNRHAATEPKPPTRHAATEPQPQNRHAATEPKPPTRHAAAESQPATRHAAAEPQPQPRGRRAASRQGRHARPADPLAITVRPVPVVRDALSEGLRAAGAVREWALWTGDKTPATGTHRAPGTLPIESWLLIGKTRQQALLAALVAVGLALVMIPVQRGDDVNPINAAGQSAVVTEKPEQSRSEPARDARPGQRTSPASPDKPARPEQPKPGQSAKAPTVTAPPSAPVAPVEPVIAVPPGDGPGRSLRFTGTPAVALTFDDGPDPVQTPRILQMLAAHGVTATFCVVGVQAQRHPEVVRQIVAAGHTLCNHSWDHSFTLGKQQPDQIRADLHRTNAAIRAAVPNAKIPFFRAPGGNFTDRLVQVAYADGMASLYWEVDPRDWEHAKDADSGAHVRKIVDDVRRSVRPGSIVLSHDYNQPDTITAYAELLPWLRDHFQLGVPTVPAPVTPKAGAPVPPAAR